ncbi:MAG: S8 family serine peptidase [Pseudomonadota bacterium]
MDGATEMILTVPRDDAGLIAIEYLRTEGAPEYSCEFVEALQTKLEGTEAAQFLSAAPVAYYLFRVPMGIENDVAERLQGDFNGEGPRPGRILAAEVNYLMELSQPTPPDFTLGGKHSDYLKMMNVPDAHADGVTGAGRTIAIVDTGIEPAHGATVQEMVDVLQNPVLRNAAHQDDKGHGTAMALLAREVAPDATIYAVRISDRNSPVNVYGVIAGVFVAAIDCMADVVNLSLGFEKIRKCGVCGASGAVRSRALETALRIAQLRGPQSSAQPALLYAAAMGNGGTASGLDHPARYPCTVPVGSVDSSGKRSAFSNYDRANPHKDHMMAPGGQTSGQSVTEATGSWASTGTQCHGTSAATAYASGMLALLWSDSRYAALDADAFLTAVKASHCSRQSGQRVDEHGSGLIRYEPPSTTGTAGSSGGTQAATLEFVEDGVYVGDVFLEIKT